jgi:hypothetical protein
VLIRAIVPTGNALAQKRAETKRAHQWEQTTAIVARLRALGEERG